LALVPTNGQPRCAGAATVIDRKTLACKQFRLVAAGPGGVSAAVAEAGLVTYKHRAGAEHVAVGAACRRPALSTRRTLTAPARRQQPRLNSIPRGLASAESLVAVSSVRLAALGNPPIAQVRRFDDRRSQQPRCRHIHGRHAAHEEPDLWVVDSGIYPSIAVLSGIRADIDRAAANSAHGDHRAAYDASVTAGPIFSVNGARWNRCAGVHDCACPVCATRKPQLVSQRQRLLVPEIRTAAGPSRALQWVFSGGR
jgi:hypothetical protein